VTPAGVVERGDVVEHAGVVLRAHDGSELPLDPARWHAGASDPEERLLASLRGPVLDVGCGPGRLVMGLARRGVPVLGVDPAPAAVELARRRGATVLQRSVFDPLPGEGRWHSVLLLDGNIGIGGDAVRLLRRCRELAAASGVVIAEVERPGTPARICRARLERGRERGAWFPWAVVGADDVGRLAAPAGLGIDRLECVPAERTSRWFAHLVAVPSAGTSGAGHRSDHVRR